MLYQLHHILLPLKGGRVTESIFCLQFEEPEVEPELEGESDEDQAGEDFLEDNNSEGSVSDEDDEGSDSESVPEGHLLETSPSKAAVDEGAAYSEEEQKDACFQVCSQKLLEAGFWRFGRLRLLVCCRALKANSACCSVRCSKYAPAACLCCCCYCYCLPLSSYCDILLVPVLSPPAF